MSQRRPHHRVPTTPDLPTIESFVARVGRIKATMSNGASHESVATMRLELYESVVKMLSQSALRDDWPRLRALARVAMSMDGERQ